MWGVGLSRGYGVGVYGTGISLGEQEFKVEGFIGCGSYVSGETLKP